MIERDIVSPEDLLASIGIHIRDFIAGFMGGVSIVFGRQTSRPMGHNCHDSCGCAGRKLSCTMDR